jgi:hypothetical protein
MNAMNHEASNHISCTSIGVSMIPQKNDALKNNDGAINLPSLSEGSAIFTRRQAVQGAAAFAVASFLPGCSSSTTSSPSSGATNALSPSNPQPTPSGPIADASLTVTATSIGAIGPAFAGLSYEKSTLYTPLFSAANTNLIALFKLLGNSILRVGGNSVDQNVWTPNGPGQTAGQIAPSDIDALAAFLKATGWQCIYGINLGGSATGATTQALAAEEVAYAYEQLGSALVGIEIGNEPDLYGASGSYYAGNWSLSQFVTLWSKYRSSILATTPGVSITGPADAGDLSTWTIPFGQAVTSNELSLLTQHFYRGDGTAPSSTAANLITPDPGLVSDLATLHTGAQGIGVPFRISECNSYYGSFASGVINSYATSLWVIDFLFDCALGGSVGTNFHSPVDGPNGYGPIACSGGTVLDAQPEYYGVLLFTLAGQGTLYTSELNAGSLNVTAYAVKNSSGALNLVVNNKDLTNNLNLSIQLSQTAGSATLLEMTQLSAGTTAPDLTAISGVTIQGADVNVNGSFSPSAAFILNPNGAQLSCYVPALSAVLVQIT